MDSSKNGRWIIPFKKFGMVNVNVEIFLLLSNLQLMYDKSSPGLAVLY